MKQFTKRINRLFVLFVALLTMSVNQSWAETITLICSDISATSYSTDDGQTVTKAGITFGYKDVSQNNTQGTPEGWAKQQVIQFKGSSGVFYNTTAISGLTNIRVYLAVNTNPFYIYSGSEAITSKPTEDGTNRPTTPTGTQNVEYTTYAKGGATGTGETTINYYDFPISDASFFHLAAGSKVLYIWKIEITYSASEKTDVKVVQQQPVRDLTTHGRQPTRRTGDSRQVARVKSTAHTY